MPRVCYAGASMKTLTHKTSMLETVLSVLYVQMDRSLYRCLIALRCRGLEGQVNTKNSLLCPFKPFLINSCSVAECIILLKEASGITTAMEVGCSG